MARGTGKLAPPHPLPLPPYDDDDEPTVTSGGFTSGMVKGPTPGGLTSGMVPDPRKPSTGRTASRAPRAIGNERLRVTLDGRTLDKVREMARRAGTSESAVLADLVRAGIAASESHPTAVDVIRGTPAILEYIATAQTLPAVCRHGCTVTRGTTCTHGRHDVAHALLHGPQR